MVATSAAVTWAQEQLDTLREDFHDYNLAAVSTLPCPSALQFSKIVNKAQPCVFQIWDAEEDESVPWPACSWTMADMQSKVNGEVDVALTPYGNADALISVKTEPQPLEETSIFLQPATQRSSISQLFDALSCYQETKDADAPVWYLQSQNSNLTTTPLEPLLSDLPQNFEFAEDVLGQPDARNIWIGDERSVTSVHRDPYENLYLVLRGSKTFRLWAPVDEIALPTKMVRTGRYEYLQDGTFGIEMDSDSEIPWVDLDPLSAEPDQVGRMRMVTVNAGQMLYLPSSWYHHVTQNCGQWDDGGLAPCIAVNYWYDQDYEGEQFVMRQLMSRLVQTARFGS